VTLARSVFLAGLIFLPGLSLAASGIVHFRNGLSVDAAFPVPLYMSLNRAMPRVAYQDAAEILRRTDVHDGDAQLSLAEARFLAGDRSSSVEEPLLTSLTEAPATADGWAFYSEIFLGKDPSAASQALDQALTLAPYDFFTSGRRAQLASHLWEHLNDGTKAAALRQAHALWDEPLLRDEIMLLLTTPDGGKFLTHAYAADPETLRAINRWVAGRRRQLQAKKH
jgi:hypothetical protein